MEDTIHCPAGYCAAMHERGIDISKGKLDAYWRAKGEDKQFGKRQKGG